MSSKTRVFFELCADEHSLPKRYFVKDDLDGDPRGEQLLTSRIGLGNCAEIGRFLEQRGVDGAAVTVSFPFVDTDWRGFGGVVVACKAGRVLSETGAKDC